MSCTVLALPYALAWVIGAVVTEAVSSMNDKIMDENSMHNQIEQTSTCSEIPEIISDKYITEKEFETPFTDKEILKKTLEEHGAVDINENDSIVVCRVENYTLTFKKNEGNKPYRLKVSCLNTDNAEAKVDDLNSEYALNVQENAYLQIIEKLKNSNLQIESEEVSEDNTIVLTINLD